MEARGKLVPTVSCSTSKAKSDDAEKSEDTTKNVPVVELGRMFKRLAFPIPDGFANFKSVIPTVSDSLEANATVACMGGAIVTPYQFFAIPVQTWNDLDRFMRTIQKTFLDMLRGSPKLPKLMDSIPDGNSLLPGLYIAVWYDHEWHRCRILKKLDLYNYTVRFIDFGDTIDVELADIRYLPKTLLEFRAQAIHCRLLLKKGRREDSVKKDWLPIQNDRFYNMIFDNGLALTFVESKIEGGERIWNVRLTILDKGFNSTGGNPLYHPKDIEKVLLTKRF